LTAGLTPAAAYLVALNYSFWQGMQVNIAADLGAEQVISVGAQGAGCANSSAYLVTFGYSTNGMTVGEIIHFENPTPWTTFPDPQCMQQDHQHFWQRCYKMMVAKWMAQAVGNSLP
jgi:hypothetical protein